MRASGSPRMTPAPSHPIRHTRGRGRSREPLTPIRRLPAAESPVSTACAPMVATGTPTPWERRTPCSRTQTIRENPSSAPARPSAVCVRSIILKVRPGRWASLHRGDRLTAAIPVLRTRMTQKGLTGMTASGTTIRNALRTLPRITTAFARPASTPGPPGPYPQHGPPEGRPGRDRSRDADRTPGPEPGT